ncbi:MAG: hypothetical protein ACXU9C_26840, partial [Xanthobacteraceae bacterium]
MAIAYSVEIESGAIAGLGPHLPRAPDWLAFRGVEMMMSMTYQSVREPFQRRLIRRSRSALRNPHAWANHRT